MDEINKKEILIISLVGFVTSILVGGAVFLWEEEKIQNLEKENTILSQIKCPNVEPNIEKEEEKVNTDDTKEGNETSITLYPVVFEPSGLFSDVERNTLMTKLVRPLIDYYSDPLHKLLATEIRSITIKKETGKYYYIVSIIERYLNTGEYGNTGYLYGSTRRDYGYWAPNCVTEDNECTFSDNYKQKYPEVVKAYNECPECFPNDIDL